MLLLGPAAFEPGDPLVDAGGMLAPGDGVEHEDDVAGVLIDLAVLFVDCCRAEGIAARFASGYQKGDLRSERRHLHAWPEVYAGEWIWMDPTFGQEVADATHVKLVTGDIERWPRLLSFLGRLEIEVLEVE